MIEMNSKNKRFFDRRLIRYPVTVRFERISSNVTASEKKKVKKDLLSIRIQKEANKTTKKGLSIQLTSNFQLTFFYQGFYSFLYSFIKVFFSFIHFLRHWFMRFLLNRLVINERLNRKCAEKLCEAKKICQDTLNFPEFR